MNPYILKNLRRRYKKAKGTRGTFSLMKKVSRRTGRQANVNITLNFNKFDKPVGAVVLTGGEQDIKDIIDIKTEE